MTNFDVVSIGSAVLDMLFVSKSFTPTAVSGEMMLCEISGGKVNVEQAVLSSGGAATNTSVSFARQGLKAAFVGELGKDPAAQVIIDECAREGVDTSLVVEMPDEQTGMSAIMVAPDGSRSAMTFRGASYQLSHQDIPYASLEGTKHIHLSSVGNSDLIRELFLWCRDHKVGLSWNPSKDELEDVVLRTGDLFEYVCDQIIVNDQEFAVIESKKERLFKMGKLLVITKGKDGGEIYQDGSSRHFEAKPVKAVSELGAGDAFASGLVGALLRGKSLDEAIAFAVDNATSVVQSLGAKTGLLR
ncbi:MAG TPA: carbohydrate kinase family protein [Patescibacteria group bacterium]|nr:carbohydrate kinase family protein [Patescibacteria group bacterium]